MPPARRGPRYVEGRTGLAGLGAVYSQAFRRLQRSRHLRLSLAFWTLLGFVYIEGFAVGVARVDSSRAATVAGLLALGWWLVISAVLLGGAALLDLPDRTPVPYYGIPNGLTALRAYSCLPIILCATLPLPDNLGLILWISVGAPTALLDAVDGYIARHVGPITALGKALDPAGDALFFAVAAVGSWRLGIIPGWLAGLILVRYVGPLLGTPIVFLARRRPELGFTEWGRRNTAGIGFVLFAGMWARLFNGPVDLLALVLGIPLVGATTLIHFAALARRTYLAPVVREPLRPRRG